MNICKVKYKIIFRRRVILYRFASKTSCAVGFDLEEHHLLLALQQITQALVGTQPKQNCSQIFFLKCNYFISNIYEVGRYFPLTIMYSIYSYPPLRVTLYCIILIYNMTKMFCSYSLYKILKLILVHIPLVTFVPNMSIKMRDDILCIFSNIYLFVNTFMIRAFL